MVQQLEGFNDLVIMVVQSTAVEVAMLQPEHYPLSQSEGFTAHSMVFENTHG